MKKRPLATILALTAVGAALVPVVRRRLRARNAAHKANGGRASQSTSRESRGRHDTHAAGATAAGR